MNTWIKRNLNVAVFTRSPKSSERVPLRASPNQMMIARCAGSNRGRTTTKRNQKTPRDANTITTETPQVISSDAVMDCGKWETNQGMSSLEIHCQYCCEPRGKMAVLTEFGLHQKLHRVVCVLKYNLWEHFYHASQSCQLWPGVWLVVWKWHRLWIWWHWWFLRYRNLSSSVENHDAHLTVM